MSDAPSGIVELERMFSATAEELFSAESVDDTLLRIVELAERTVAGCTAAGIFFADNKQSIATATNHSLIESLNFLQFRFSEGPCLEAATLGTIATVDDLADDDRWPLFAQPAQRLGLRSVLAYPLSTGRPSALNLYSMLPCAFSPLGRAQGHLFSTLARLALDSAYQREDGNKRADNLTEALRTRELIGQAQGILMERKRITANVAFDVLRLASQQMNLKLRDVAENLVRTGELPNLSPANRPTDGGD